MLAVPLYQTEQSRFETYRNISQNHGSQSGQVIIFVPGKNHPWIIQEQIALFVSTNSSDIRRFRRFRNSGENVRCNELLQSSSGFQWTFPTWFLRLHPACIFVKELASFKSTWKKTIQSNPSFPNRSSIRPFPHNSIYDYEGAQFLVGSTGG